MRTINTIALAALITSFLFGCSPANEPEQKDWENTTSYFKSTDERTSSTYYRPYAGFVGDVMPFFDPLQRDFKILYLQEYRPNTPDSYHPFWGVTTTDAATYTSMGEVLPTGSKYEQDAALGTGCVVYNEADKLYYIFYTGNFPLAKATDNREVVMYATSPDFKTWTKNPIFRLAGTNDGYSRTDFRDPCVWKDGDTWHMIVSTKQGNAGVLAEYTSSNLQDWIHKGVFSKMVFGDERFMECVDIFQMGEWWYAVYSDMTNYERRVHYIKGRTIDELKHNIANPGWPDNYKEGALDSRAFYAGKTATDGTNRYIWGWCPTRAGEDNTKANNDGGEPDWAGSMVVHRIQQNSDGTISLVEVPAIRDKYNLSQTVKEMVRFGQGDTITAVDGGYKMIGYSSILFNTLGYHNHLSMTVTTTNAKDGFGLSFARGTDYKKYYSVMVRQDRDASHPNSHQIYFEEENGIYNIAGAESYSFPTPADKTYKIDIYTDNSVFVMYINGTVTYTNRIYGIQRNCWSVNCYEGEMTVKDIQLKQY